jgi:hypothetical protein
MRTRDMLGGEVEEFMVERSDRIAFDRQRAGAAFDNGCPEAILFWFYGLEFCDDSRPFQTNH